MKIFTMRAVDYERIINYDWPKVQPDRQRGSSGFGYKNGRQSSMGDYEIHEGTP